MSTLSPEIRPKPKRGLTPLEKRNLRTGLLFISPWIIGFSVFLAYPIAMSIYYSLCDFSVLQEPRFVGLSNYQQLLTDDVFWKALSNTVFYAAGAIPLGILMALTIALLLNTNVRGMAVYRTIFFLPSLVPAVAMAILWLWILNGKNGILNFALGQMGRPIGWLLLGALALSPLALGRLASWSGGKNLRSRDLGWMLGTGVGCVLMFVAWQTGLLQSLSVFNITPPSWLSKPEWVKPAFILVSLCGTGQAVVVYLAGLQDVPVHLYEAADLDGAQWWQKLRHVTLPMVSPVILFNGIMAIIGTFNYFALPFVMAPSGQPARSAYFLAVNLFDNAFQYLRMGYASAMAWILFVIVFTLTIIAMKLSERHVHYGE